MVFQELMTKPTKSIEDEQCCSFGILVYSVLEN